MAKGKYTTPDLRAIIAASRSGSATWPIEIANTIGRTYGAILTMIGRIGDAGLSLEKIEEALDKGVVPESHGALTDYLTAVRNATKPAIEFSPLEAEFHGSVYGTLQIAESFAWIIKTLRRLERKIDGVIVAQGFQPEKYNDSDDETFPDGKMQISGKRRTLAEFREQFEGQIGIPPSGSIACVNDPRKACSCNETHYCPNDRYEEFAYAKKPEDK